MSEEKKTGPIEQNAVSELSDNDLDNVAGPSGPDSVERSGSRG